MTGHCPLITCNCPPEDKIQRINSIPMSVNNRYRKWVDRVSSTSIGSLPRLRGVGYSEKSEGYFTIYYHLRYLGFRQITVHFAEPRWFRRLKYTPWLKRGIDYNLVKSKTGLTMEWHRMKTVPSIPGSVIDTSEHLDKFKPAGYASTQHLSTCLKKFAFGSKIQTQKYGFRFIPSWEDDWEPLARVSKKPILQRVRADIDWSNQIRAFDTSWAQQYNERNS